LDIRRSSFAESPVFRPLYVQIRDVLIHRIATGVWRPGEMLPNEFRIAADLGVSQGTVRKALDEMAAEHVVARRQGKGTFVAAFDEARLVSQFLRLKPDSGVALYPSSRLLSLEPARASSTERKRLRLGRGEEVLRVKRLRLLGGAPFIFEAIVMSRARFGALEHEPFPHNLYETYAQRFGMMIRGGRDQLKATGASAEEADALHLSPGHALLAVERITIAVDDTPIEWRRSVCSTENWHYDAGMT
jgi:GntR family transcriptional regulator